MRRILIIADEKSDAREFVRILEDSHHQVQTSVGKEATLNFMQRWKPELVIILSEQTDQDCLTMLRETATADAKTQFVLVSKALTDDDTRRARLLGAREVVQKPDLARRFIETGLVQDRRARSAFCLHAQGQPTSS